MSTNGEQKILHYQYLPITQIQLHTVEELKQLKHHGIIAENVVQCNKKMQQLIDSAKTQNQQNKSTDQARLEYRKWSKQVDKICNPHCKLTQIQRIQLFNNVVLKTITSEPQLVLILSKLNVLPHKDLKQLYEKCV